MLIVAIRTFILYAAVLFAVRLMGKSELSKMSPFQMVVLFMIAELAAIPIDSTSASLVNGVMAIFTLMLLQIMISFLATKSEWFKGLVTDKPSILIDKGRLNEQELKRLRITTTDLMESNGQLTVIPKAENHPLTPKDMQLAVTESMLPMILIADGKLYEKNLRTLGISKERLDSRLAEVNLDTYQKIFLAFYDENKQIHLYLHAKKSAPFAAEVIL